MTAVQAIAHAVFLGRCRSALAALQVAVWLGVPRDEVLAGLVEVLGGAAVAMGEGEVGR